MRAQEIYENLDFERGQDPKDSMRIGRKWQFVEEGDIVKVFFDYTGYKSKKSEKIDRGYVKVLATSDSDSTLDTGERYFEGRIIEPEIDGEWAIEFSEEKKEWVIQEG